MARSSLPVINDPVVLCRTIWNRLNLIHHLVADTSAFMRVFPALVAYSLLLTYARAQDASEVPNLLKEYSTAVNDSARTRLLSLISFHMVRTDPDSARLTGEQALAIAQKLENRSAIGDAHNSLGWLEARQGNVDSANTHLQLALSISERSGDQARSSAALVNLGWLAQNQGNDMLALKYFLRALGDAESAKDTLKIPTINYSIGISYRKAGEFEQALEYFQRAMRAEQALGRNEKVANCLMAIANIHRD